MSDKDRAVDDLAMLEAVAAPILLLDSADKITFANAACRAHHPELAQISADGGETLGAVADLAIHRQALADGMTLGHPRRDQTRRRSRRANPTPVRDPARRGDRAGQPHRADRTVA